MENLEEKDIYELFLEWSKPNLGTWINRSQNVAIVAKKIAIAIGLDEKKAYSLGLIYDIGRVKGNTGVRHTIDGYNFLKEQGYNELAKVCITHAFITKDIANTIGEYDITNDEYEYIKNYLRNTEFDIYDKLIQLADSMALPDRIVVLETRIMDVCLRYGMDEKALENAKGIFKIQSEIEEKLGYSIYKLFPEIKETFDTKKVKDTFKF